MKSITKLILSCCAVLLLTGGCSDKDNPEPECLRVETVGPDCDTGWHILEIVKNQEVGTQAKKYIGQLESGFVTTDNLPQAYRQPGVEFDATLELNGEYGPRCVTITVMYPAVKITNICSNPPVIATGS
ncbi:hypothetical protein [Pontibacter burrus]|uniref:Lipoprotein n=1 Tax=Pontibacter burrus TaxID=2704466 RepID=A0A6B3LR93_9BACT|nr:hypothetical protein [Pontibacter burrus]NEM96726.1 hypothetical protein [Pontibacter burrus]